VTVVDDPVGPVRVERGLTADGGSWCTVERVPHPRLAGGIVGFLGYEEDTAGGQRRRHLPSGRVVLIIGAEKMRMVEGPGAAVPGASYQSFVAGLHDRPAVSEHDGIQAGVEVLLTPVAARTLLGVPMAEVAGDVVPLDDLLGAVAGELADRCASAPTWDERFAAVDDVLLRALEGAPAVDPRIARAWRSLATSGGSAPIGPLADELGWSRRHLADRFRHEVGVTPKVAARLLRFERASAALVTGASVSLATIAVACGYYDQAHLNREFKALAGCTPTAYRASQLAGGGSAA
jgi:AraC-like DNA-binding protein